VVVPHTTFELEFSSVVHVRVAVVLAVEEAMNEITGGVLSSVTVIDEDVA